jgi:hypothetical protein
VFDCPCHLRDILPAEFDPCDCSPAVSSDVTRQMETLKCSPYNIHGFSGQGGLIQFNDCNTGGLPAGAHISDDPSTLQDTRWIKDPWSQAPYSAFNYTSSYIAFTYHTDVVFNASNNNNCECIVISILSDWLVADCLCLYTQIISA